MLVHALDLLRCPDCARHGKLSLEGAARAAQEIETGAVRCEACGKRYPIEGGILDFVGEDRAQPHLAQRLMEFSPLVRIYETLWRPALLRRVNPNLPFEEEFRLTARLLKAGPGDVVADLACGTGNYTRRWAQTARVPSSGRPQRPGAKKSKKSPARTRKPAGLCLGFDRSRPMLAEAVRMARAEGIENISFIRAEVHRLPLAKGAFSRAGCCAALHLFSDPAAVLEGVAAALSPGGRFACVTVQAGTRDLARWIEQGVEIFSGLHFFEPEELPRLVHLAGLEWSEEKVLGPVWICSAQKPAPPPRGRARRTARPARS